MKKRGFLWNGMVVMTIACICGLVLSRVVKAEEKLCLPDICIGDDITQVTVNWIPVTNASETLPIVGMTFTEFRDGEILIDSAHSKEVNQILALNRFDAATIGALKYIKATCKVFELQGAFESKSGLLTRVKIMPFLSDDKSSLVFRVVNMQRFFAENTEEAIAKIVSLLKENYPTLVEGPSLSEEVVTALWWKPFITFEALFLGTDIEENLRKKGQLIGFLELQSELYASKNSFIPGVKFEENANKELREHSFCQGQLNKVTLD